MHASTHACTHTHLLFLRETMSSIRAHWCNSKHVSECLYVYACVCVCVCVSVRVCVCSCVCVCVCVCVCFIASAIVLRIQTMQTFPQLYKKYQPTNWDVRARRGQKEWAGGGEERTGEGIYFPGSISTGTNQSKVQSKQSTQCQRRFQFFFWKNLKKISYQWCNLERAHVDS